MFIRSVKVPSSNGTVHEYVRIVGSVRDDGKVKQKVIANLGRRDTLEAVLPLLNRFLTGAEAPQALARQLGTAVTPTAAVNGEGLDDLWTLIARLSRRRP